MTCGIYRIYNKMNGKSYIGQSKNVEGRIRGHFRDLNRGIHCNCHLQSAFLLYGNENFDWQLVEVCEEIETDERERYWTDVARYYADVYNIAEVRARPDLRGRKLSKEHRKAISVGGKGRKLGLRSDEHRRKLSEAKKGKPGRKQTDEERAKRSRTLKGRKFSEEHKRKLSESFVGNKKCVGRVLPQETRTKISESLKRRNSSKED